MNKMIFAVALGALVGLAISANAHADTADHFQYAMTCSIGVRDANLVLDQVEQARIHIEAARSAPQDLLPSLLGLLQKDVSVLEKSDLNADVSLMKSQYGCGRNIDDGLIQQALAAEPEMPKLLIRLKGKVTELARLVVQPKAANESKALARPSKTT